MVMIYCPDCGGHLIEVVCLNVVMCDTCDYIIENAN